MRLQQVAQRATDLDRAATFYSTILGSEPSARFERPAMLFFDLDGVRLMLDPKARSALIYLRVDDVAATVESLRPTCRVLVEPRVLFTHQDDSLGPAGHDELQAEVEDPDGNVVGLISFQSTGESPLAQASPSEG